VTNADPLVSLSTIAPSVYFGGANVLGLWHFDENTGTTARDFSGFGNSVSFALHSRPLRSSTPTFVQSRPSFGTALNFTGQLGGVAVAPDAAQYDSFAGSFTITAWMRPAAVSMANHRRHSRERKPGRRRLVSAGRRQPL